MLWSAGEVESPLVVWSKDNLKRKKVKVTTLKQLVPKIESVASRGDSNFTHKGQFTHHKEHFSACDCCQGFMKTITEVVIIMHQGYLQGLFEVSRLGPGDDDLYQKVRDRYRV